MRKITVPIILGFLCLVGNLNAQNLPINSSTGKVTWLEVVETKGMAAADLFQVLNEWCLAQGFHEKSKDATALEAVYEGNIPMEYTSTKSGKNDKAKVNFTYSFFCKEGKYRYIATDFVHEGVDGAANGGKLESQQPECGRGGMVPGNWVTVKNKTLGQMNGWIQNMKKKVTEVNNDPAKKKDW